MFKTFEKQILSFSVVNRHYGMLTKQGRGGGEEEWGGRIKTGQ